MRNTAWLAVAAGIVLVPAGAWAQPQSGAGAGSNSGGGQQQSSQQSGQSSDHGGSSQQSEQSSAPASGPSATTSSANGSGTQTDSLVAAARKARAEKKDTPKTARTFTNDNLPTTGGISTVGDKGASSSDAGSGADASASGASGSGGYPAGDDEKGWRAFFDKLRTKESQDEDAVAVSQRELGQIGPQFYTDPNKGMVQELTRSDINKKTAEIDAKKKDVETDKAAIASAEDALRAAGGDAGWAR